MADAPLLARHCLLNALLSCLQAQGTGLWSAIATRKQCGACSKREPRLLRRLQILPPLRVSGTWTGLLGPAAASPGEGWAGDKILRPTQRDHAPHRAAGLSAIISMLPSSEHVKEAYLGPRGVLSLEPRTLHPHLLIDASTIDPLTAREVAAAARDTYLHPHAAEAHDGQQSPLMIDAPVSGGVPGAQAGSLTFMCGGTAAAVDAARPLLEVMGKRIIYCESLEGLLCAACPAVGRLPHGVDAPELPGAGGPLSHQRLGPSLVPCRR